MPRFSIIVPTRERRNTLGPCLASCRLQTHPDFEIVVQDNDSRDGTEAMVREIGDPRIKYFRTPTRVSMRSNFEAGFDNAKGDFLICIGDDDGVVPGALERLDKALSGTGAEFVSWPTLYYYWPGYGDYPHMPVKRTSVLGATRRVDCRKIAQRLANAEPVHFRQVPKVYHGCVARSLIDRLRTRAGVVFAYDIPDIYAQVACSLLGTSGLSVGHPASIIGASRNSTGTAQFSGASETLKTEATDPFGRFMAEANNDRTSTMPLNPSFAAISYYTLISFGIAKQRLGIDIAINDDAWIERVVKELSRDANTLAIAKKAQAFGATDEKLIARLALLTAAPEQAPPTGAVRRRRNPMRHCEFSTVLDGTDNVHTASRVFDAAFGARGQLPPALAQLARPMIWAEMLRRMKPRLL